MLGRLGDELLWEDRVVTTPTVSLGRIGQIAVRARDLERATAFYRDTLGLRFLFAAPPHLAFFDCAGVRLMLDVPVDARFDHPSSILYFSVEGIAKTARALEQRGVRFESAPHVIHRTDDYELWMAFFEDSEGNMLALMEEKRSERR